ncbi:ladderlectin-like isoform X2 [Sparus aurata]|uniref:ladderlectin-like isoform X2 n=1 Tax=Sparus aurata TaxID=8175 RepID=UPI0011C18AB7|nr:ladderlectin-like isoform X2 [Sparus aurata]
MRIILLLCAALALTITAVPVEEKPAAQEIQQVPVEEVPAAQEIQQVPVEEKPAAQEIQQDGELPVEVEVEEVKLEAKTGSCSAGWAKFGSRCFNFISSEKTWVEAERYCLRFGTNLASVHSQEEYEFVQEVVRGTTGRFPQAWLGANDAVKDGAWLWSDGSKFYDGFWAEFEPNNYMSKERCVVMNLSAFLLWGDVSCDLRRPFVCGTRPQ